MALQFQVVSLPPVIGKGRVSTVGALHEPALPVFPPFHTILDAEAALEDLSASQFDVEALMVNAMSEFNVIGRDIQTANADERTAATVCDKLDRECRGLQHARPVVSTQRRNVAEARALDKALISALRDLEGAVGIRRIIETAYVDAVDAAPPVSLPMQLAPGPLAAREPSTHTSASQHVPPVVGDTENQASISVVSAPGTSHISTVPHARGVSDVGVGQAVAALKDERWSALETPGMLPLLRQLPALVGIRGTLGGATVRVGVVSVSLRSDVAHAVAQLGGARAFAQAFFSEGLQADILARAPRPRPHELPPVMLRGMVLSPAPDAASEPLSRQPTTWSMAGGDEHVLGGHDVRVPADTVDVPLLVVPGPGAAADTRDDRSTHSALRASGESGPVVPAHFGTDVRPEDFSQSHTRPLLRSASASVAAARVDSTPPSPVGSGGGDLASSHASSLDPLEEPEGSAPGDAQVGGSQRADAVAPSVADPFTAPTMAAPHTRAETLAGAALVDRVPVASVFAPSNAAETAAAAGGGPVTLRAGAHGAPFLLPLEAAVESGMVHGYTEGIVLRIGLCVDTPRGSVVVGRRSVAVSDVVLKELLIGDKAVPIAVALCAPAGVGGAATVAPATPREALGEHVVIGELSATLSVTHPLVQQYRERAAPGGPWAHEVASFFVRPRLRPPSSLSASTTLVAQHARHASEHLDIDAAAALAADASFASRGSALSVLPDYIQRIVAPAESGAVAPHSGGSDGVGPTLAADSPLSVPPPPLPRRLSVSARGGLTSPTTASAAPHPGGALGPPREGSGQVGSGDYAPADERYGGAQRLSSVVLPGSLGGSPLADAAEAPQTMPDIPERLMTHLADITRRYEPVRGEFDSVTAACAGCGALRGAVSVFVPPPPWATPEEILLLTHYAAPSKCVACDAIVGGVGTPVAVLCAPCAQCGAAAGADLLVDGHLEIVKCRNCGCEVLQSTR